MMATCRRARIHYHAAPPCDSLRQLFTAIQLGHTPPNPPLAIPGFLPTGALSGLPDWRLPLVEPTWPRCGGLYRALQRLRFWERWARPGAPPQLQGIALLHDRLLWLARCQSLLAAMSPPDYGEP